MSQHVVQAQRPAKGLQQHHGTGGGIPPAACTTGSCQPAVQWSWAEPSTPCSPQHLPKVCRPMLYSDSECMTCKALAMLTADLQCMLLSPCSCNAGELLGPLGFCVHANMLAIVCMQAHGMPQQRHASHIGVSPNVECDQMLGLQAGCWS